MPVGSGHTVEAGPGGRGVSDAGESDDVDGRRTTVDSGGLCQTAGRDYRRGKPSLACTISAISDFAFLRRSGSTASASSAAL